MTTTQVVETSVNVNNSPIQDYVHQYDHTQTTFEMPPGFKPFTVEKFPLSISPKLSYFYFFLPLGVFGAGKSFLLAVAVLYLVELFKVSDSLNNQRYG